MSFDDILISDVTSILYPASSLSLSIAFWFSWGFIFFPWSSGNCIYFDDSPYSSFLAWHARCALAFFNHSIDFFQFLLCETEVIGNCSFFFYITSYDIPVIILVWIGKRIDAFLDFINGFSVLFDMSALKISIFTFLSNNSFCNSFIWFSDLL